MGRFRPYAECKDSGVEWLGEIPTHWDLVPVKHRYDVVLGKMLQPETRSHADAETPYFKALNVNWEEVSGEDLGTMWASPSELDAYGVHKGDLLVCEGGEVGRAAILAWEPAVPTIIQNALHRVRASEMEIQYLLRALEACAARGWLDVLCNKATIQHFTREKFVALLLPWPSHEEQRAIAASLDNETAKIDALVAKKERLIELLQEKRTALISHAVTKGLDPHVPMKDSSVEWLGEIPAHWETKRLRHVGDAIIGLTYEPADVVGQGEGVLVLRASNVSDGHVVFEDKVFVKCAIPQRLFTRVDDILICSRSGSRALIGKNARIGESTAGLTFGTFMTIFRSACNEYLFYAFNSTLFDYQSGAFLTSTINQLTIGNLYGFTVPIPPREEQAAIAAFLDRETARIDALAAKAREGIERLREYRTALISAAVTGKIDVRGVAVSEGF
jgi:type I restriction enzyme S subunit